VCKGSDLANGTGATLEPSHWEVWYEDNELYNEWGRPLVGTTVKLNDKCPHRPWRGALGKVVKHNNCLVYIDWFSFSAGEKPNREFSFPNSNVDVIKAPPQPKTNAAPSLQVGNILKNKITEIAWKIITTTDDVLVAECVHVGKSKNWSVGCRGTFYRSAFDDPDWIEEKIEEEKVQQQETPCKIGQLWYDESRKWKVVITGITGKSISAMTIEGGSSGYADGSLHGSFATQKLDPPWKALPDLSIQRGDRVRVYIDGHGHVSATVINEYTVYLDVPYAKSGVASWDAGSHGKSMADAVKALGLDPTSNNCWKINIGQSVIVDVIAKKERKTMREEKSFGETLKEEFKEAGWRAGASGVTLATKAAILKALEAKGADDGRLKMAADFLETEMGSVAIRALLGFGLQFAPGLNTDERALKLAKEFRVSAMDRGATEVMSIAMEFLLPAVTEAVKALPPVGDLVDTAAEKVGVKTKTKHRVASDNSNQIAEEEEAEEESKEAKTSAA
jgi:hypothetical protein